ncbi:MAG TPA: hypothetical protein VEL74_15375, partial [Thermoanaerobaculia bacterium]|nr:hypothetical protein [Thermoanaerobaculia bacterium]
MPSTLQRRVHPAFSVLVTLLLLAGLSPLQAAEGRWSPIGPEGGSVRAFGVSPSDHTVYAGTSTGMLFRSTDAGASWTMVSKGAAAGFRDILVHPSNPRILYTRADYLEDEPFHFPGHFPGAALLAKSTDAGETWTSIGPDTTVLSLVMAPSAPDTLYAGESGKVIRSTDGGATWTPTTLSQRAGALAVDPVAPGTVYAGAEQGLYKSLDGGATWALLSGGATGSAPRGALTLTIDPSRPATVYAGDYGGIWKSLDGGTTWAPAHGGIEPDNKTEVVALAIDPSATSTLYASVRRMRDHYWGTGEIWKSTNGGSAWVQVHSTSELNQFIHELALPPASPNRVLAGVETLAVLASGDGGQTWAPANRGLTSHVVWDLESSPFPDDTLLAATSLGLFRSTDRGAHWERVLTTRTPYLAAFHPRQAGVVYAGAIDGLYRSTDFGRNWTLLTATGAPLFTVGSFVIDPSEPRNLYATGYRLQGNVPINGIARSTDGGASWIDMGISGAGRVLTFSIDPVRPSRLYASGTGGVFRSTDRGKTWQQLTEGLPSRLLEILVDPDRPDTLYAVAKSTADLYRSDDGGDHWHPVSSTGLAVEPFTFVNKLAKAEFSNRLYATTMWGVYLSTDGGQTWEPWSDGLEGLSVGDILIDPTNPYRLYAASGGGSVLERSLPLPDCVTGAESLCLNGGRFLAEVTWRLPDGTSGRGQASPLAGETGGFWFFNESNLELMIKVLDGRAVNESFWVFYAALSDVEYTVRITDTVTGETRLYRNPAGRMASVADTSAFRAGEAAAASARPAAQAAATAQDCGLTSGESALCLQDARFTV